MQITVFGCGYVGLTAACCFAEMGYKVLGVDIDKSKIECLKKGDVPFFEPGLQKLLSKNLHKNLSFDDVESKNYLDVTICAVQTPVNKKGETDYKAVLEVAEIFAKKSPHGATLINKSTVPVGANELILKKMEERREGKSFNYIYNPEFLRQGSAVKDFMKPDRIIVGVNNEKGKSLIKKLYKKIAPILFTDFKSAEIIKYSSNFYLAMRISFINEIANFCDLTGADIVDVKKGVGLDKRIGLHFFNPGIGFGGSCLPKDLNALIKIGSTVGFDFNLANSTRVVNQNQIKIFYEKIKRVLKNLKGKKIAIWGLTFKANTDDLREAPSVKIIKKLLKSGAEIVAYDPILVKNVHPLPHAHMYSVLKNADALLILTDWPQFQFPDCKKMKKLMRNYNIFDGRNILNPTKVKKAGFKYFN